MKVSRLLLLFFAIVLAIPVSAKKTDDTLLIKLFQNAERYDKLIRHYESDIYIKGTVHLKGKNRFMHRIPQHRSFAGGVKDYFSESTGSLDYTAPFTFDREVKAVSGTFPSMKEESDMLLDYFNLTIYRESLIRDHLLSPFSQKNDGFYKYRLDSIHGDKVYYTYTPKYHNTQLVSGHFVLNKRRLVIEEVYFEGQYEFMKFKLKVKMGLAGIMAYLPMEFEFKYHFNFVGNKLDGEYQTVQRYNKVETVYEKAEKPKSRYDLTERYANTVDTTTVLIDSAFVASHRFLPLEAREQNLYVNWKHYKDSIALLPPKLQKKRRSVGDFVEDFFFDYIYINLGKKLGRFRINPLLDISVFNYSTTQGYAYRQDFKYVYHFPHDQRLVMVKPRLGYNLSYKQFFWRLIARYEYLPRKEGAWEMEVGNGNRIRGAIKGNTDQSAFSNNYIEMKHEMELFNGFKLYTGVVYHDRRPWKLSNEQASALGLRGHYRSFSPNVRFVYTPGQYYYYDEDSKKDVYSRFPTLEVAYEVGLKGVLGSTSRYERLEGDLSYEWSKDTMHKFAWRIGGGKFTNKDNLEFVDFHNFKKHYLPDDWDDELGGRFTLLDSHWFNESLYYLRAHFIYESPLLLMGHLNTKFIQRERLYLSALHTDQFKTYFEFGYGFSTPIVALGFYLAYMDGKYKEAGVKYSITLFR